MAKGLPNTACFEKDWHDYEDANAGIFQITTGQEEGPAIASTNPLVAADIHHAIDRYSGMVFVCNNREYEIQVKNPDGTTRLVTHKTHEKLNLDGTAKDGILEEIAPQLPLEARQRAKEQIPDTWNAGRSCEMVLCAS